MDAASFGSLSLGADQQQQAEQQDQYPESMRQRGALESEIRKRWPGL